MDDQLAYESATDLLALISTKQVSPVEITEIFLNRIEKLDPKLHAFLFVDGELSMKAATVAEQTIMNGDQLGPLHGLPIPVKDSQNTANITTTAGSLMYKDRRPERDSAVVERIKGAGAIILGKTNIPEFAMVGTCENRLGEWGLNPWDTNRSPGGSSGGAAAAVRRRREAARDPAGRYQTAAEVAEALQPWSERRTVKFDFRKLITIRARLARLARFEPRDLELSLRDPSKVYVIMDQAIVQAIMIKYLIFPIQNIILQRATSR